MVPIVKSKNNEYSFNQFINDIKKKTNEAILDHHILTHCILIYSRANPIISKILNDEIYYNALDEIANKYLNIYHADANISEQYHIPRQRHANDTFGYMTSVDYLNIYEDNHANNEIIRKKKEIFDIEISDYNPALLFFHVDNDNIVGNYCIEIEESEEETTFLQIKGIIAEVVKAVRYVTPENVENQEEVFNLAKTNLQSYKIIKKIAKIASNPLLNVALALKP